MIWYGGVELGNLSIVMPSLHDHIARYVSTMDVREFYRSQWPLGLSSSQSFNVPSGDWPYNTLKLDSLFWPVGASSWAVGHYLVSDEQLNAIRLQAYSGLTLNALPLRMDDADGGIVETNLFMLPPRPLAQIAGCDGVWLLTLVDERYNWWNCPLMSLQISSVTTWSELLEQLQDCFSFTFDDIDDDYLGPSKSLNGDFQRLPPLLDSVAYSLGMRVIRTLDGDVKLISATTSRTAFEDNFLTYGERVAGGRFALDNQPNHDLYAELPHSVEVAFPRSDEGTFKEEALLSILSLPEYAGVLGNSNTKRFADDVPALMPDVGILPINHTELRTLARQIATDYYRWRTPGLDLVIAGCVPWDGEAHSVMTEWCHSQSGEKIYTRLQRGPDDVVKLYHGGSAPNPERHNTYLVRMLYDAVPDNHPEFPISGPFNAVVQEWNVFSEDWEDGDTFLWVTCLDRLPLREDDRFWVELHDSGKWVPTYEPRNAGVRVENTTPDDEGLYSGFVRVFDDVLVSEADGVACKVYDSNGLGLDAGIYAGCDLIGHRDGVCIYRATCCTGELISGSVSGSEASGSNLGCPCVPDTCGSCGGYTMSTIYDMDIRTSGGTLCAPFSGGFALNYAGKDGSGNCTWKTSTNVDQRSFARGKEGPTWMLKIIGGIPRLFAAGTDVDVAGTMPTGCSGNIRFNLSGWKWDTMHGCGVLFPHPVALVPRCACPSGSGFISGSLPGSLPGSVCAPMCPRCTISHCQYKINLENFGADLGCPNSCVVTPSSWITDGIDPDLIEFGGTLAAYSGGFNLLNVGGCDWRADKPGGVAGLLHTGGTNTIALTLFGAAGGGMNYAGVIDDADCCKTIQLFRTTDIPEDATAPESIFIEPNCTPATDPCKGFNVGDLYLTAQVVAPDGDCYWSGDEGDVHASLLFNGTSWSLTLSGIEDKVITYRADDPSCCNGKAMLLESSNCFAPNNLTLTPVTPCDNCCTDQAQWYCMEFPGGSGSGDLIHDCCPPDGGPFPRSVSVRITNSVAPMCVANGTYRYVYRSDDPAWIGVVGNCAWTYENDTPEEIRFPWFFANFGEGKWQFKFESAADFCAQDMNPSNPFETTHECSDMTIDLSFVDSDNNMTIHVFP